MVGSEEILVAVQHMVQVLWQMVEKIIYIYFVDDDDNNEDGSFVVFLFIFIYCVLPV